MSAYGMFIQAIYQGPGDKHQPDFTNTEFAFPIALYDNDELILEAGHCAYSLSLYFSSDFSSTTKNHLKTISPIVMTTIFVVMAAIFCIYDRFVYRRNAKIVDTAARSNEILSSMFPSQVRDRLYAETERRKTVDSKSKSSLDDKIGDAETTDAEFYKSKPIADLFPATTILFADIVGFTAWSSIREPTQVFILLETIFRSFDVIAKKRRIFKVCFKRSTTSS